MSAPASSLLRKALILVVSVLSGFGLGYFAIWFSVPIAEDAVPVFERAMRFISGTVPDSAPAVDSALVHVPVRSALQDGTPLVYAEYFADSALTVTFGFEWAVPPENTVYLWMVWSDPAVLIPKDDVAPCVPLIAESVKGYVRENGFFPDSPLWSDCLKKRVSTEVNLPVYELLPVRNDT